MSDLIEEGPGVYYTGFSTGQGGDPSTYKLYAEHLDVNFLTLLDAANRTWSRLMAMTGINAEMVSYIEEINDADGPEGADVDTGRIGEHSYACALKGGDATKIEVQPGSALRSGELVTLGSMQEVDGTGVVASPPGWAYLSWDANGVVLIDDGTSAYDFARWYWDSGQFTGSVEYLTPTFFDGDAWRELQEVPANLVFQSGTQTQPHYRLNAIERLLSGYATDALANSVGPIIAAAGAVDSPSLALGVDGTPDSLGIYRPGANQIGLTDGAAQVLRWITTGIRYAIAGSAGTPVLQLNADNAGLYSDGTGPAVSQAGARCMRWDAGCARHEAGTAALPAITPIGDPNTGHYSSGADKIAGSTAGEQCYEFDDHGALTLAKNPRLRLLGTDTVAHDSALADLSFDSADYDVSHDPTGWWDSGTDVTVPSDGIYLITAHLVFDESTAGVGGSPNDGTYRAVQLEINGTTTNHGGWQQEPVGAGDTIACISEVLALTDGWVITLQAAQNCGDTMDVIFELSVTRLA